MNQGSLDDAFAHGEALFAALEPKLLEPARPRYARARELVADLWDEDLALRGAALVESSEQRGELAREAWERCVSNGLLSVDWLGDQRVRFQWLDGMSRAEDVSRAVFDRLSRSDWPDRDRLADVASVVAFAGDIDAIESARVLLRPIIERPSSAALVMVPTSKLLRVRVDRTGIDSSLLLSTAMAREWLSKEACSALDRPVEYPITWRVVARRLCHCEALLSLEVDASNIELSCVRALREVFSMGLAVEHGYWSKKPGTFIRLVVPTP